MTWTYRADNLIYLRAPIDDVTGTPISPSSTVTSLLYENALDTTIKKRIVRLVEDAGSGFAVLTVDNTIGLESDDEIEVSLDDGSLSLETIDTTTDTTISLTGTLDGTASKGADVRKIVTSATGTILSVYKARGWAAGYTADYEQDDLTVRSEVVSAVNEKLGLITLPAGPTDTVSVGLRVRRRVGTLITLAKFGTFPTTAEATDPADETWGFVGTVDKNHADTYYKQQVACQVTAVDASKDLRQTQIETFE